MHNVAGALVTRPAKRTAKFGGNFAFRKGIYSLVVSGDGCCFIVISAVKTAENHLIDIPIGRCVVDDVSKRRLVFSKWQLCSLSLRQCRSVGSSEMIIHPVELLNGIWVMSKSDKLNTQTAVA